MPLTKADALKKVQDEIRNCPICPQGMIGLPVPGEGNAEARFIAVGEAPGAKEAETGRPFIGRSGKLLTQLLESIGISREEIYITSPVSYFPGRRAPTPAEVAHGRTHFFKQVTIIDPEFLVCMGATALYAVTGDKMKVMQVHGKPFVYKDRKIFPTLHPAAAIRFQKNKALIESDFQELKKYLDNTK
ncbi:MAG: uracil-DNA glycosylase family protein [Weeksellaceae bacterium]